MQLTNVGAKLKDSDVKAFEKEIGFALPTDYIAFLKKTNGGMTDLPFSPIFGFPKNPSTSIEFFYGIVTGNELTEILRAYRDFQDRLVKACIPIAYSGGGDQIVLMLDGPLINGVFFWDYYSRKKDMYQRVYPIATSFTLFLKNLIPAEEVDI